MTLHAEDIEAKLVQLAEQWPSPADAALEWGLCVDCTITYIALVNKTRAAGGLPPLTGVELFTSGFILGRATAPVTDPV